MKSHLKFILIATALAACTSDKSDSAAPDDLSQTNPLKSPAVSQVVSPVVNQAPNPVTSSGWAPVSGHWTYGSGQLIENTCSDDSGDSTDTDPAGFTLSSNGENEIVLTPDGSSDTVTCVLTNMDFDCQKTNAEVTVPIEGIDFHLNIETASNGFFSDETSMTTLFTLTTTCLDVDWNI